MIQQMFVAFFCFLLATQQITAVVNNSKTSNAEETAVNKTSAGSTNAADSVAASTGQDPKRREASIISISDSYGAPLTGSGLDSYVPSGPSNPNLPIPVYGAPDAPSNNIVYPAPPPDIPPPPPETNYIPPIKTYGPPHPVDSFQSLPISLVNYGPPIKPPKPFIASNFHGPKLPRPRPQYGPPKPVFVSKGPKINFGPPKSLYGPPKLPSKPLFVPQKTNFKQQTVTILTVPSQNYGVSNIGQLHGEYHPPQSGHFGPPEPIPHGPPHPGVPAPPTPPDIKYDGWQPIPGLVSRPPSDSYGVPEGQHHGGGDLHFDADLTPPPAGGGGHILTSHVSSSSHSVNSGYSSSSQGISDSYGAPLNAVTGSGGVVSSSGDSYHDDQSLSLGLSAAGINSDQSHLSVIKSIGYELFPNNGGGVSNSGGGYTQILDTYSYPPLSSYSPNGPYAAAHSYKSNGISSGVSLGSIKSHHASHNSHSFHNSHGSHSSHGSLSSHSSHGSLSSHGSHGSHGLSLSSSGIGLIPPSGFYGSLPSSHYGTPLLSKPSPQYGAPLNALKINPPKHPVVFREPVPKGLIESIGKHTAHKDAHGIIDSSHSGYNSGPTYIPPPIPDLTKPVKEEEPPLPSNLYSLPSLSSGISFHGSSSSVGNLQFSSNQFGNGHSQVLTSYTAPLGSVDGSYGLPLHSGSGYSVALDNAHSGGVTVGIDNSHPPITIDLTSSKTSVGASASQLSSPSGYGFHSPQHDCTLHKSQPLPSLSYGVPSANSYTASLSSLTTNIGGGYHEITPALTYGTPDLQTAHSQKVKTSASTNAIQKDTQGKAYGKSLAASFGAESELIKSQSIDINNIPVQGALGSYTLQIQPADSLGGAHFAQEEVQHAQVLNNGLLQSILAAIEQPNKKGATILGQPLLHLQPNPQSYEPQVPPAEPANVHDVEGQQSVTNEVVVSPPVTETAASTTEAAQERDSDADASLRLIDNNEIALYFSNNPQDSKNSTDEVRNGQQYGSFVTFKRSGEDYESTDEEEEERD